MRFLLSLLLACLFAGAATAQTVPPPLPAPLAFPGAVGPAAQTPGGRGGRIIRVTSLEAAGPGTLRGNRRQGPAHRGV